MYEDPWARRRSGLGNSVVYGGGIILLVLIAGFMVYTSRSDAVDGSGCLIGLPAPSTTAVLIDQTDDFSPIDAELAKRRMTEIATGVPEFGRLAVYRLDYHQPTGVTELAAACAPKNGNPKNIWERLVGRPTERRAQWQEGFGTKIAQSTDTVSVSNGADYSPIMRGIYSIGELELASKPALSKKLILFSDFFENSDGFNFYRQRNLDWSQLQDKVADSRLLGRLGGVDVEAHVLPRDRLRVRQEGIVLPFWEAYFNAASARSVSWDAPDMAASRRRP